MTVKDVIEIAVLFILLILFVIWLIYLRYSIKLTKRLDKHIIGDKEYQTESFIDRILKWYNDAKLELIDDMLKKSKTKKIDKRKQSKDISNIIDSLLNGCFFVILYVLLSIFYLKKVTVLSSITAFILGFMLPGIIYLLKEKHRKKAVEKDLLQAINIISNNLQANRSIREAILDTTKKIDGELKNELLEVVNNIDNGLSLEVAFKRMQNRCEIEDLTYLTTALSILSKTGGNIKEVFSYLEDLFETRKKLDQELEATIASSKLVYFILSILPIIVFTSMVLIYDNYLSVYLNTVLGKILGIGELLLYFIYIIVIRKLIIIDKY